MTIDRYLMRDAEAGEGGGAAAAGDDEGGTATAKSQLVEGVTVSQLEQRLTDAENSGGKKAREAYQAKMSRLLESLGVETPEELGDLVERGRKAPQADDAARADEINAAIKAARKEEREAAAKLISEKDDAVGAANGLANEMAVERELAIQAANFGVIKESIPDVVELLAKHAKLDIATKSVSVVKRDGTERLNKALEPMSLGELIEEHVATRPHLVRSNFAPGAGQKGGSGGGSGSKSMTRNAFDALNPVERAAAMKAGTELTD